MAFTGFFLLTFDLTNLTSSDAARISQKTSRFSYALVMTYAPDSDLAIFIDFVAAIFALFELIKGASRSIKMGIIGAGFLYFFVSLLLNYETAPV